MYNGTSLCDLVDTYTKIMDKQLPLTTVQPPTVGNSSQPFRPTPSVVVDQQSARISSTNQQLASANTVVSLASSDVSVSSGSRPMSVSNVSRNQLIIASGVAGNTTKPQSVLLYSNSELFPWRRYFPDDFWSRKDIRNCDLPLFGDTDVW